MNHGRKTKRAAKAAGAARSRRRPGLVKPAASKFVPIVNHGLIPYIGGKHRLAFRLVEICAANRAEMFVDVFGGSAAVTIAAAKRFQKLVYNDIDGDLVNLFRVISDRQQRVQLFQKLRWLPPSRRIFNDDSERYLAGGHSFCRIPDSIERARCTLYRHAFAFGGKVRNGGFAASCGGESSIGNRERIKEVMRYRNILRKLVTIGETFRRVLIENLDFSEIIRIHGDDPSVVLFIDPPYVGSEGYYSRALADGAHHLLAHQLGTCAAQVVCTYYDAPLIRDLYPVDRWHWQSISATKNSCLLRGNKVITSEFVLTKRFRPTTSHSADSTLPASFSPERASGGSFQLTSEVFSTGDSS